eukprot:Skav210538  [mRNA]  locus=scaffold3045:395088:396369:- [translate_table: standard]
MCASCHGKKKVPPPAEGFFAKLFGISAPVDVAKVDSDSDYEEDQVDEQTGLVVSMESGREREIGSDYELSVALLYGLERSARNSCTARS